MVLYGAVERIAMLTPAGRESALHQFATHIISEIDEHPEFIAMINVILNDAVSRMHNLTSSLDDDQF